MPLSEHEQRRFEELERQLLGDSAFVKNMQAPGDTGSSKLLALFSPVKIFSFEAIRVAKEWKNFIFGSLCIGALTVGALVTLDAFQQNEEKVLTREGVELALKNPQALRVIGACGMKLHNRALEVDEMLRTQRGRQRYGYGPTSDELRRAVVLADEYRVPCEPPDDGAYTFNVDNQPVTIQFNDILWQNPSSR